MLPERAVSGVGGFLVLVGVVGLILGLIIIDSLSRDFEASLEVTQDAVTTIGETIELIDGVEGADSTLRSASAAASSAAGATRDAVSGMEGLVMFMDEELPADIDAIARALPGAIDAADAVDDTLGALSLIGVDYAPEEPFGESLRRIQEALGGLPDDVRSQSTALRRLMPSARALADDVEMLGQDLDELSSSFGDVSGLAESYGGTVADAGATVARAQGSLDRTVLFLRITLILAALAAMAAGAALISLDRRFAVLSLQPADEDADTRVVLLDER